MRRFAIAIAALGLVACLDTGTTDTSAANDPSDPSTETFTGFNPPIVISQMTKTSLGDYYADEKVGTGPALVGPQIVIFSYVTFLKTGLIVDQQLEVQQDLSQVVRGLQDGIVGMRAGGERVIVVPSALAFGSFAKPPIPANSTLVFDVVINQIP
jgi:FKBP-type peptidyl-prolyl cis-trans isomerase FkpA